MENALGNVPKISTATLDDKQSCGAKINKITIPRYNDYSRGKENMDDNGEPPADTDDNDNEKDDNENDDDEDEE